MRESERQINIYKAMLPRVRERLMAALALFIIAIIMTVLSSFAWIVLSVSPEIKGMNTIITANGNLEIALATGNTIIEPADVAVGDSGKNLFDKNITWGNLINLGDPVYGLENIVLRPATLNLNYLRDKPLYAAGYGADGRVDMLENEFSYAYWNQDQFSADENRYGVRAVASVTYGEVGGNLALAEAVRLAETANNTAASNLRTLTKNPAMQELVGLMAAYVNAQIEEKLSSNKEEPIINVTVSQIDAIYYLMNELKANMELSADALAQSFNVSMLRRAGREYTVSNAFTGEYLLNTSKANIQTKLAQKNASKETIVSPAMLSNLWQLKTDYDLVKSDLAVIETYIGRTDVVYRNLRGSEYPTIETFVNHVAEVSSVTVNGVAIGSLSMSNIFSLTGGGTKPIVINKGIIQRMDKFTGAKIESEQLSMTVMGSTAKGKATTSAATPFVLPTEYDNSIAGDTSYKGTDPIAGDTFGMALDFFVRTNAPNSHLILQGSPVYGERDETVTVKVENKTVNLYTVKVNGEDVIAYLDTDENAYYEYDRESETAGEKLGTTTELTEATLLTEKVRYVIGYEGVNRVWDEGDGVELGADSTTQGAGSCYVFYANSPEDQTKSLQLLQYFKIAFIDEDGTLLGTANLDTENKIEQTGKTIVPLVASVTNDYITGQDGNPLYTITKLTENEAKFITALVYLEGEGLTNDKVLAAGEIQGELNIQFGTTADLDAMDDPVLIESTCHVTATMEGDTSVSIDNATEADLTKTVTVKVDGYEPNKVEAYFLREINSTQGIRQGKITFEQNANGDWVGSYKFTTSGKYVLREVMLDGITYELNSSPIVFTVEGFTISSVYCEHNNKTYMTTNRKFDTSVSINFASSDPSKMPASVKGAFIHEETGNRTTVYFKRTVGSTWEGSASFTTTGKYKLEYLELDDQYVGLSEDKHVTIDLYLGLSASIYTGENNFAIENGQARDVPMSLMIKTDTGESIGDLTGVWLQYSNNGSGIQENGIGASMVWNSTRGMYEGTFRLENPGIYKYHYVSIDLQGELNYLYIAAESPTITAISSTIPEYVSKSDFGETFALNNDATFKIRMRNADSATIDAVLKKQTLARSGEEEIYYVRGVMSDYGDEQEFTFMVPVIDGVQSGTWTLDGIYMTNVYGGKNNTLFDGSTENGPDVDTPEKPMYTVADNYYFRWWKWDIEDLTNEGESTDVSITVISNIDVSLSDSTLNANRDFGRENNIVTATFGTVHKLGALELNITAGSGRPISDFGLSVTGVELKYNYDQTGVSNSGGTITNPFGSYKMTTGWTELTSVANTEYIYNNIAVSDSDNTKYTITANRTDISIAGRYKAVGQLALTVEDSNGKLTVINVPVTDLRAPTFYVWSKAMNVSVKSIAPNKANHKSVNKTAESEVTRTSSFSGNNVKIYCEAHKSGQNIAFDTYPRVELTLSDMGDKADSIEMPFTRTGGGEVYLYTGEKMSGKVTGYEWTTSADCTRYVGQYKSASTCSSTSFIGAGILTGSNINITMGNYTYIMTVDTVTINNPHIEDE